MSKELKRAAAVARGRRKEKLKRKRAKRAKEMENARLAREFTKKFNELMA